MKTLFTFLIFLIATLTTQAQDPLTVNATATPDSICVGDTSQLNAEVTGNVIYYLWTSGSDTFTSNIPNPVVSPDFSTIYYVTVSDGVDTVMDFVRVFVPSFNIAPEGFACENQPINMWPSSNGQDSIQYTSSGDGYFEDDFYYMGPQDILNEGVTLTGTAFFDDCEPLVSSFFVEIVPNIVMTAGDDVVSCDGVPVQLNSSATGYTDLIWSTTGDGFFSGNITAPVYTPGPMDIETGSAELIMHAINLFFCNTPWDTAHLSVDETPEVSAGNDTTICCNSGGLELNGNAANFDSLAWTTSGDGYFENPDLTTTLYIPGDGDIADSTVTLTLTAWSEFGCSTSDSIIVTLTECVAVVDLQWDQLVSIHPNPSGGDFFLTINSPLSEKYLNITITNINGLLIQKMTIRSTANYSIPINLTQQPKGIYLLKIVSPDASVLKRFVIQ